MTKWLEIIEIDNEGKKTNVWAVKQKSMAKTLGHIKWYSQWRKYGFFPLQYTVFEWECLRYIADFCQKETRKYKENRF